MFTRTFKRGKNLGHNVQEGSYKSLFLLNSGHFSVEKEGRINSELWFAQNPLHHCDPSSLPSNTCPYFDKDLFPGFYVSMSYPPIWNCDVRLKMFQGHLQLIYVLPMEKNSVRSHVLDRVTLTPQPCIGGCSQNCKSGWYPQDLGVLKGAVGTRATALFQAIPLETTTETSVRGPTPYLHSWIPVDRVNDRPNLEADRVTTSKEL